MPLMHFLLQSVQEPFRVLRGGTSTAQVLLSSDITILWDDNTADSYVAGTDVITDAATGAATVDGSKYTWHVVTYKGAGHLYLVRGSQLDTLDRLLTAAPVSATNPQWGIVAEVSGVRVTLTPDLFSPIVMVAEGDTIYNHSTSDPTDPTTPPRTTILPIGGVGQLMQVIPDPDDPHQTTTHSADPAWTTLNRTEGMLVAYKIDNAGTRKLFEIPIGTAGQVLATRPDPNAYADGGTPSSHAAHATRDEPSFENIGWVLGQHLQDTAGDLVIGVGGGADAAKLSIGANFRVLTSNGTTASWQLLSYALAGFLAANGDLITRISGSPALLGIGSTNQVLNVVSGLPHWDDLAAIIKAVLLPNPGDVLVNQGGTIQAISPAPSTPSVLIFNNSGDVAWLPAPAGSPQKLVGSTSGFGWTP